MRFAWAVCWSPSSGGRAASHQQPGGRSQPMARLLGGPPPAAGAESFAAHQNRLGALPTALAERLIPQLEALNLLGRGGAGFPVGRKWRGVAGRPTLVQNVESLAAAALIARGDDASTGLVTLSGSVRRAGVQEIALDATLAGVAAAAGGPTRAAQAVLLGGYFGAFAHIDDVWALPLQPRSLRARRLPFGCRVIHFLAEDACGVDATGRIMSYLASQSARQCGPCLFGLEAIATATRRLAARSPQPGDLDRLMRWRGQIAGRGACQHPHGATGLLRG